MKNTPKAGPLPNASIDFNKVHDNARAGKADIYAGAVHAPPKPAAEEAPKGAEAAAPAAAPAMKDKGE